ncbi:MAG: tRNA pseudouridine synthase A, partial [Oscillospiraceae bacterium]|nr:tRNA pseudouridine synthase A [Oscillospiraceae bacterium]
MKNIALRLSYLGTAYHGWQRQKTEITVQETLENALSRVCGEQVSVVGCGRTDAGVHAQVYCANFRTSSSIPPERLPLAVNSWLPRDISVSAAEYVDDDFNAVLSCVKKEYT